MEADRAKEKTFQSTLSCPVTDCLALHAETHPPSGTSITSIASTAILVRLHATIFHPSSLPGKQMTYADTTSVYGFVTVKPFSTGVPDEFKRFFKSFRARVGVGRPGYGLDFKGSCLLAYPILATALPQPHPAFSFRSIRGYHTASLGSDMGSTTQNEDY